MLEHSPYSLPGCGQWIDFELRVSIDECPIKIQPKRTPRGVTVHWECVQCGHAEVRCANQSWSRELLDASAKLKASEHMMRMHPGPLTRAMFKTF